VACPNVLFLEVESNGTVGFFFFFSAATSSTPTNSQFAPDSNLVAHFRGEHLVFLFFVPRRNLPASDDACPGSLFPGFSSFPNGVSVALRNGSFVCVDCSAVRTSPLAIRSPCIRATGGRSVGRKGRGDDCLARAFPSSRHCLDPRPHRLLFLPIFSPQLHNADLT